MTTVQLFDGSRRHLASGIHRRDGWPGWRDPKTGRVTPPIPPQSAPRALCGECWWPMVVLADDMVRHAGEHIARRKYLLMQARPMCGLCALLAEEAA